MLLLPLLVKFGQIFYTKKMKKKIGLDVANFLFPKNEKILLKSQIFCVFFPPFEKKITKT
jgi:hypothetical protein